MQLTGTNSSIGLIVLIASVHLFPSRLFRPIGRRSGRAAQRRRRPVGLAGFARKIADCRRQCMEKYQLLTSACALPTWWLWRGGCTRSHSELGRETPQRRWYFVSRHGRVGRCQVCKTHVEASQYDFRPLLGNTGRLCGLLCFRTLEFVVYPRGDAGWSSPVARQAHNLKAAGSNPAPATKPF
jgi:hypothetical protein